MLGGEKKGATHSFLTSISAHSHHTSANSSTRLYHTLVAFSNTLRALTRSGSASPETPPDS